MEGTRARELELPGDVLERRTFTTTYSDTSDLQLARTGITLARRLENGRSLWRLTLPPGTGPLELEASGGPAGPPPKLERLLKAVVGRRELGSVATLRVRRAASETKVLDRIDVMDAQRVAGSFAELRSSNRAETDPARRLLRALGFRPPPEGSRRRRSPRDAIEAMARAQRRALLRADPGTRLGTDPEHVHEFRVAARRLRALLRSARPMLDAEWADGLRAELGWLGRAAGSVRDLDVLLMHLHDELRLLDPLDVRGARAIVKALERERRRARASLLRVLESDRYFSLLVQLEDQVRFAPAGEGSVAEISRRQFEKLNKTMKSIGPQSPDEELHAARIRVKRARYAAELAASLGSAKAARFVGRAKVVQDVLGDHQDALVAEVRIRELASAEDEATSFAAGRLVERQRARRTKARANLPKAWRKLKREGKRLGPKRAIAGTGTAKC
jgi:CHAD domain-containing protein